MKLRVGALAVLLILRDPGQIQFDGRERFPRFPVQGRSGQEDLSLCLLFEIALALKQQRLIALQLLQELRQQGPVERDSLLAMLALLFSSLLQNEISLPL